MTIYTEVQEKVKGMMEGDLSKGLIQLRTKTGKLISLEIRMLMGQWEGENVLYGIGKDLSEL